MENFKFTAPFLSSKDSKKWMVRYKIEYPNQKPEYRKEFGKRYNLSINGKDLKLSQRKENAELLMAAILSELELGIDPENSSIGYQQVKLKALEAEKKYTLKYNFDFYFSKMGYDKPTEKQKDSARNIRMFFENQFIPYFTSIKINDVREITKQSLRNYLDYQHATVWEASSVNVRKGWISAFLGKLVEFDILPINPIAGIKNYKTNGVKKTRFQTFSEKEIETIFSYCKENKLIRLELFLKIIYYAYIRKSETRRLTFEHLNLVGKQFEISGDITKKGDDDKIYKVKMHPELLDVFGRYIKHYNFNPNDPTKVLMSLTKRNKPLAVNFIQGDFDSMLEAVKIANPSLFNKQGQTIYSFKHSGVQHRYNKLKPEIGGSKALDFVRSQCRHQHQHTTEIYLQNIGCDIAPDDNTNYFL
ncbi:site-specific integrase [Pedobacter sp. MC2016-05]|uniref:tyrosine-type recombinase/integrase n=1 Tax=Pedobacter sp. MC2016-05 TaxID=2994474 RepID=UPI0022465785|nr:site-specific integrase [Pedobacter sp. MC2016-05]MCX2474061.1 site-specific integrase [Pedobacter sp. MC2016-05]